MHLNLGATCGGLGIEEVFDVGAVGCFGGLQIVLDHRGTLQDGAELLAGITLERITISDQ